jgi:competence protein ComEC
MNHAYDLPISKGMVSYHTQLRVYCVNRTFLADTTFAFTSTHILPSHLKVHFINVQQGDAILIQTPDGKNIQIDGGYGTLARNAWQGGGEALALNYLVANDVTHLHYIIETHRHQDHWGGLNDILNSHITHDFYISPSNRHGYSPGARLSLNSPVEFTFYNIGYPPTYSGTNLNNTSIVLKMTYGDAEFLFTGDAEGAVQEWLWEAGFNISVDVLKVSHHGASTNSTSTPAFLSQVLNQFAQIAILSYGTNNPYEHPRSLPRFNGFQTFGTNPVNSPPVRDNFHFDTGTIIVLSDGRMVFVTTER